MLGSAAQGNRVALFFEPAGTNAGANNEEAGR